MQPIRPTVTAEQNQLQTETGSRENTITASQIENLSIISRTLVMATIVTIISGVIAFPIAYYMARVASPRIFFRSR